MLLQKTSVFYVIPLIFKFLFKTELSPWEPLRLNALNVSACGKKFKPKFGLQLCFLSLVLLQIFSFQKPFGLQQNTFQLARFITSANSIVVKITGLFIIIIWQSVAVSGLDYNI